MITLYHASPKKITEITDNGLFGGIFASPDQTVALSHADKLHIIELDDSEILTDYALNYELDFNLVKEILERETYLDENEIDEVYALVVTEKNIHSSSLNEDKLLEIFKCDSLGEASWECQRLRGVIAKEAGYKAIETKDEHGITYLVLSSAKINQI